MSNFESKLKINNSPDIGKIIDESFTTFKKTIWISGAAIILLLCVLLPITFFAIFSYLDISSLEEFVKKSQTLESDFYYLLMNAIVSMLLAIISTPFIAGFYKINHLANQNKEFGFSNFFEYYKASYFMPLALSSVLIHLYSSILGLSLMYFDLKIVASIIQIFISFLFIFAIPLIIFENQNATSAMANSAKIAMKHPFSIIICFIFGIIIAILGVFAFCLGIFFTIGYIYTINYTLYNEIIPIENTNPIDEIGIE